MEKIASAQMHAMSKKTTLKAITVISPRFNQAEAYVLGEFSTISAETMVGADMDGSSKPHTGDAGIH